MKKPVFTYTEISRTQVIGTCRELHAAAASWHFHALTPDCRFNPRPGQYCFVIEDSDAKAARCAFSPSSFVAECHELVQVLHGDAILDPAIVDPHQPRPDILRAVEAAYASGEPWHHHMMKPGCVLSPAPDQHVITLERKSSDEIEVYKTRTAPDDVLREIELFYFGEGQTTQD